VAYLAATVTMRFALAAAFLALAPQMPEGCSKALGKKEPAQPEPLPPPPAPVASVSAPRAPPIWHPPEPTTPPPSSSAQAELAKVRSAADAKNHKLVRTLLDKKAKSGKATDEEVKYLHDACTALKDKTCLSMLHGLYDHGSDPDAEPETPAPPTTPTSKKKP
jgi:hypothetical protein